MLLAVLYPYLAALLAVRRDKQCGLGFFLWIAIPEGRVMVVPGTVSQFQGSLQPEWPDDEVQRPEPSARSPLERWGTLQSEILQLMTV